MHNIIIIIIEHTFDDYFCRCTISSTVGCQYTDVVFLISKYREMVSVASGDECGPRRHCWGDVNDIMSS